MKVLRLSSRHGHRQRARRLGVGGYEVYSCLRYVAEIAMAAARLNVTSCLAVI